MMIWIFNWDYKYIYYTELNKITEILGNTVFLVIICFLLNTNKHTKNTNITTNDPFIKL